jgi:hypothetical protein
VAACRQRSNVAASTGSSVKRRIVRAVAIASQTSPVTAGTPSTFRFHLPEELTAASSGPSRAPIVGIVRG